MLLIGKRIEKVMANQPGIVVAYVLNSYTYTGRF